MRRGRLCKLIFARVALAASALLFISAPGREILGACQSPAWSLPACSTVTGTGAVTFTSDRGTTLASTSVELKGIGYAQGLAVLDTPNTLLAAFNTSLLRSVDAGCGWTEVAKLRLTAGNPLLILATAPGGRAYGWSQNGPDLIRFDPSGFVYLRSPVESISGLGTSSSNGDHLRLGDDQGRLWDSIDAGVTWTPSGVSPVPGSPALVYRTVFDAQDLNHALVGTAVSGAFVTRDGGGHWTASTGLSSGGGVNVFNLVVAPSDGQRVWAMGLELSPPGASPASAGRHIYVSKDGGTSFEPRIDQSPEVTLINGPLMAVPPDNPDVLYFVFGSSFQKYGTDLFRFDEATRTLTKTHNAYDKISSIGFSPAGGEFLYLGLAVEERSGFTVSGR